MSLIKIDLTFLSSGEDELNEGNIFTSKSHGCKFLSNKTSNPYSSKHTPQFFYAQL